MTITTRTLGLALLLTALTGGFTASIAQGGDPPSTAAFTTVDGANQFQLTQGTGSPTSAEIVTGGDVTFTNMSVETHDVDLTVPAQGGVSCQQTTGGASPSPARFPNVPTSGSWAGVCTFTKAGTYSFECDHHPGMTGTVVVSDAGSAGSTTTQTSPVVTATTPAVVTAPAASAPSAPAVTPSAPVPAPSVAQMPVVVTRALAFTIRLVQHGASVRGSLRGATSAGRVRVSLTSRRGALGLAGTPGTQVGVGSLSTLATSAGAVAFTVKLDGMARAALARRHRLAITLHVTAPNAAGVATSRAFTIVVRP